MNTIGPRSETGESIGFCQGCHREYIRTPADKYPSLCSTCTATIDTERDTMSRTGFLNWGPIEDADERLGTYVEIRIFGWLFRKEFIWTRHRFDEKVSKPWTKRRI